MDHDQLVLSAKAGDADAFTELVRRYQAMAFGYAYARVGDFHLAEDLAQQAFLAAWRSLHTLNDPARFGGWLRRIVQFECAHFFRDRPDATLPLDDARAATATDDPSRSAERSEGFDHALAAINRLPQAEREVTILFYLHDHSEGDESPARQLRAYLTQPFFVAEEFTGRAGQDVSPEETVRDCLSILAGDHADLNADDLSMTGSLRDAAGMN